MSNQILNFLDVDLSLYVNNVTNFANSETSTNLFNSNANLAFSDFETKNLTNNFHLQNSLQPNNMDTCDLDLSIDPLILLDESESSSSMQNNVNVFQAQPSDAQNLSESVNMNVVSPCSILNFEAENKQDSHSLKSLLTPAPMSDHNNNNLMSSENDSIYLLPNSNEANEQLNANSGIDCSHLERSMLQLYSHSLDSFISNPTSTSEKENRAKHELNSSLSIGPYNSCLVSMKSQNFDNNFAQANSDLEMSNMSFQKEPADSSILLNAGVADMSQFMYKDEGSLLNHSSMPNDLAYMPHEPSATDFKAIENKVDIANSIHLEEFNFATSLSEESTLSHMRHSSFGTDSNLMFEHVQPVVEEKELKSSKAFNQQSYQHFNPLICSFEANTSSMVSNNQIAMMIPTANGIISRSNSQPDLTLSIDRIAQPPNSYYYHHHHHHHNHSAISQSNGSMGMKNAYSNSLCSNGYYVNGGLAISSHGKNLNPIRRHPSLSYKTSMSECNEQEDDYLTSFNVGDYLNEISRSNRSMVSSFPKSNNVASNLESLRFNNNNIINMSPSCSTTSGISSLATGSADDGILLGSDAYTDFLTSDVTFSGPILTEEIPILEDLMSLKFELSPSSAASLPLRQTQCDLNLPDKTIGGSGVDCNPLSNYFDYCNTESATIQMSGGNNEEGESVERTTRSAPPSPKPQKKKQRPTGPIAWNKPWTKMEEEEHSRAIEYLTRTINDEMGLREQLEIIRILNPEKKPKPTDTQFIIDLKIIDDDKYKRIKEVVKTYGLFLSDKPINDNSSDCSALSCPLLSRRDLRIKRAQQRLKLKQKKEQRQIAKENKSRLFVKNELVPLSQVLPEEETDVDIMS